LEALLSKKILNPRAFLVVPQCTYCKRSFFLLLRASDWCLHDRVVVRCDCGPTKKKRGAPYTKKKDEEEDFEPKLKTSGYVQPARYDNIALKPFRKFYNYSMNLDLISEPTLEYAQANAAIEDTVENKFLAVDYSDLKI
jgi:hypothetical protein